MEDQPIFNVRTTVTPSLKLFSDSHLFAGTFSMSLIQSANCQNEDSIYLHRTMLPHINFFINWLLAVVVAKVLDAPRQEKISIKKETIFTIQRPEDELCLSIHRTVNMQVHWKVHTSQRVLIIWPCFTGHINSAIGDAPGEHHKNMTISIYKDTCVSAHTPNCICLSCPHVIKQSTHVKMHLAAAVV